MLIHREVTGGVNYEVRTAGASRRLYTNGAFHTQYHPGRLFNGGIWDALTYPAALGAASGASVLLLGLGGGVAVHQLHKLLQPSKIVAVELDPVHVRLAHDFFDLSEVEVTVVTGDAKDFVRRTRARFDVIIDDIFVHAERSQEDPFRPVFDETTWRNLLNRRLTDCGILVRNHIDVGLARADAVSASAHFNSVILCTVPQYANVVTAAFRLPLDLRKAKARCRYVGLRVRCKTFNTA